MLNGEASLVKVEPHFHAKENGKGIIRKIREAFDPEAAEMVYAAADMQRMKSLAALAEEIMKLGVPSNVAYVWAYDTKRGVDRLTNFSGVLDKASEHVEEGKDYAEPSREFVDSFTPIAERASEDYARELLGKLLAGEMESPGSFSKRTLSILGDMSKADAEAFEKLCGCCVEAADGPYPMLVNKGEPFDLGAGAFETLNALGLTDFPSGLWSSFTEVPISQWSQLGIGGATYRLRKDQGTLHVEKLSFTKYGLELASLFDFGTTPGFAPTLVEEWKKSGISVQILARIPGVDGGLFVDV